MLRRSFGDWYLLGAIILAFLAVRLPVMYLQPGGEDEGCYSVPGLTILRSGIPQLPHVPARNLESVYYCADKIFYTEPPLYFYLQAAMYALLPPVYGTARLASALAGIAMLAVLWKLTKEVTGSLASAAWACGLFSLSRWFYFPATRVRPDILCALLGLVAVLTVVRWQKNRQLKYLTMCGVSLGMGGLTHPFAIMYAMQIAIWLGITERGWSRLKRPCFVAAVSLAVFSLWLILILREPEIFQRQAYNQMFSPANPHSDPSVFFPWRALRYHAAFMWQHIGAWQMLIAVIPTVGVILFRWRQRDLLLSISMLAISANIALCLLEGDHHYTLGYWAYPAALMFIATGWAIATAQEALWRKPLAFKALTVALAGVLVFSFVPGAGLRTLIVHLQHAREPDYNEPLFSKQLLTAIPERAVCVVDHQFALNFVAAQRPIILATNWKFYHNVNDYNFDYVIASRFVIQDQEYFCSELQGERGKREDLFACYAQIRRAATRPCGLSRDVEGPTSPSASDLPH